MGGNYVREETQFINHRLICAKPIHFSDFYFITKCSSYRPNV